MCPTALSKRRVLVCAPSNAAVDEIVLRVIQQGLLDGRAKPVNPVIVRAGVATRMHPSVMAVSLDSLITKRLDGKEGDVHEVQCTLLTSDLFVIMQHFGTNYSEV